MANKIRFTFFHKRVHPFLIILAVVHRAAHALNALEFVRVHGVCFAQHAQFFFDEDRKKSLEEHREKLKTVVFQQGLGTMYEKTERLEKLADFIADAIGAPPMLDQLLSAALSPQPGRRPG